MSPPEPLPLWLEALRDSLLGPRGLVKTVPVWLAVAVTVAACYAAGWRVAAAECLPVWAAVAAWSLTCILANDLADRADDLAAGKARWVQRLRPKGGWLLVAVLALAGALVAGLGGGAAPLAAYAAALALGVAYSVRPVRLKERGLVGPLAYSAAGTLAFAVLPWAWIVAAAGPLAVLDPVGPLAVVGPAVFLDKWVNLHFHQVIDHDADRARGSRTYAVRVGAERARHTLQWAAALAFAWMVTMLVAAVVQIWPPAALASAVTALAAVAAGAYARVAHRRTASPSALLAELPPWYLGLSFAFFRVLPLALLARLAVEEPRLWLPTGLAAATVLLESWHSVRYRYT
jgi:4-hydroxybenzoate polyprenyltransferase